MMVTTAVPVRTPLPAAAKKYYGAGSVSLSVERREWEGIFFFNYTGIMYITAVYDEHILSSVILPKLEFQGIAKKSSGSHSDMP